MEGWIKIHRRLLDWEWMNCPNMVALWVYLLMKASNEDKDWQGETLEKGQLVTSVSTISKETGIPVASVRRGLDRLIMSKQVSTQTTKKWTKITICKYESYQQSSQTGEQTSELCHEQTGEQYREKKEIYNISLSNTARAYEDWRYVSSAAKAAFNHDADMIADYKRRMMAKQLDGIAVEIGMPEEAKEKFLQRWAEHNPGSETIAAEYENTFDLRDRAVRFMTWWNRNNQTRTATPAQQPTRSDRFAEGMKKLDALFDGYGQAAHPVDEQ